MEAYIEFRGSLQNCGFWLIKEPLGRVLTLALKEGIYHIRDPNIV